MALKERFLIATVHVFVLALFLGKGACDSICPNGITNITGTTSGELVYPMSGTYGVNETKCWRIEIPKAYRGLGIYIHSLDIEECKDCDCDRLAITTSYGSLMYGGICGRKTSRYQEIVNTIRGKAIPEVNLNNEDIWIRLNTDDSENLNGFNISYVTGSHTAQNTEQSHLNASHNETLWFGTPKVGTKNYTAGFEWDWFLYVNEGSTVQITFESFELEQSDNCEKAYLEIREVSLRSLLFSLAGGGQYGAILLKPTCGTNKPSTIIESAGNMVWVHFKSDRNSAFTAKGFNASFTASQGRLSISHPMTLMFISVLLVITSKDSVF